MQRVIKSHQIIVYGATLLVKIGGPWTRSMIGGSMDPVHILMDPVHGPGVHVLYFPPYHVYKLLPLNM